MLFWKKAEKWHEVRWFNGPRDIYLAIQFAGDADRGEDRPTVERLPSKDAVANAAQPPLDESQLVAAVDRAVAEYNRKNLCALKVAGIRYRVKGGADLADHGLAARKLLNLL
ncbi:MAG: hypothetical protein AVDCRST_MAG64-2389 [uncultured Phycisphaerae bacterium]|uniref:Uncharacterized protein n=1 Tax=uncultured Phycisphaerae bacterium TaxID=904963 RepID=A0A6J4PCE6_9BACT|nr:MAG: hypothetical protein AVDCRST_MAG64-2389 [uncultured Phycisphaerae bacterium]